MHETGQPMGHNTSIEHPGDAGTDVSRPAAPVDMNMRNTLGKQSSHQGTCEQ
jgi:hypothetical protein